MVSSSGDLEAFSARRFSKGLIASSIPSPSLFCFLEVGISTVSLGVMEPVIEIIEISETDSDDDASPILLTPGKPKRVPKVVLSAEDQAAKKRLFGKYHVSRFSSTSRGGLKRRAKTLSLCR